MGSRLLAHPVGTMRRKARWPGGGRGRLVRGLLPTAGSLRVWLFCSWLEFADKSARPTQSELVGFLLRCSHAQALFLHQPGYARNGSVFGFGECREHIRLFLFAAILTQLELGFEFGRGDFESHDVAEHAVAVGLVEAVPLLRVGGLESGNEFV